MKKATQNAVSGVMVFGMTVLYALVFIIVSILFFFLNVWIIKVGAGWAGYENLDGNWVVLTAGLMSAASIIASAINNYFD